MLNMECRGCHHDQSYHVDFRMPTANDKKHAAYRFECQVDNCTCTMDGSPAPDKIRPVNGKPIAIFSGTDLKQLESQLKQQAETPGPNGENRALTDPQDLWKQPVGGVPWED